MSLNDTITAKFSLSAAEIKRSDTLLTQTNPIVSSILLKSYPLIIITNEFLEFFVWLSRDSTLNVLYLSVLYLSIYFSDTWLVYVCFPTLIVSIYCSINFYVNSVYVDVNNNENPTLKDILDHLENFITRFSLLLRPVCTHSSFTLNKIIRLIIVLSPLHIVLLRYFISPKNYLLTFVVIITNFNSIWLQSTIKLLWRSLLIRRLSNILGFHSSNSKANYKILNGINTGGKIIQFQIFEHQRRWIGIGWGNQLLPYERSHFTNEALQKTDGPAHFKFPFNFNQWKWLEENWNVDPLFNKSKDINGWVYYDNYWQHPLYTDSISSYTRTRKWSRKAVLVVKQYEETTS
ncbi:hypothetical protein WICMUC_000032 [Wickerhamomyces mucosus]|uniref:Peroxin/Ferlin domain-containing protein n=1 Tax=Wickerhamomyces mucosus TaxID=1378264 RepID=A0A9P8Q125_9ASCO|nr:hypothetical protein WICMUC_000032 [Wickerhamomyces mucosus]